MITQQLIDDMCNLKPDLPLLVGTWRDRITDNYSEPIVTGMCPLCTLAVKQDLISLKEIAENKPTEKGVYDVGRRVYDVLTRAYGASVEELATFVVTWDNKKIDEPATVEAACHILEQLKQEGGA